MWLNSWPFGCEFAASTSTRPWPCIVQTCNMYQFFRGTSHRYLVYFLYFLSRLVILTFFSPRACSWSSRSWSRPSWLPSSTSWARFQVRKASPGFTSSWPSGSAGSKCSTAPTRTRLGFVLKNLYFILMRFYLGTFIFNVFKCLHLSKYLIKSSSKSTCSTFPLLI